MIYNQWYFSGKCVFFFYLSFFRQNMLITAQCIDQDGQVLNTQVDIYLIDKCFYNFSLKLLLFSTYLARLSKYVMSYYGWKHQIFIIMFYECEYPCIYRTPMYLCCICVCIESFIVIRHVGINGPLEMIGLCFVSNWTRILSLNLNNNGYKISI